MGIGDYDTIRLAELFGKYIRLNRKLSGFSLEVLKDSEDYRELNRIEGILRDMNFSGDRLIEIVQFSEFIFTSEDIMQTETYKRLAEKHDELEESHAELRQAIKDTLKPFEGLRTLLKD